MERTRGRNENCEAPSEPCLLHIEFLCYRFEFALFVDVSPFKIISISPRIAELLIPCCLAIFCFFPAMYRAGPPARAREVQIDREKVCPLLLRCFISREGHHTQEDFKDNNDLPSDEIKIYTWKNATLRELTDLVKASKSAARAPRARLSFAFVYPDRQGKNIVRQVGSTLAHAKSADDSKTLAQLNFDTGDYLDVAIYSR